MAEGGIDREPDTGGASGGVEGTEDRDVQNADGVGDAKLAEALQGLALVEGERSKENLPVASTSSDKGNEAKPGPSGSNSNAVVLGDKGPDLALTAFNCKDYPPPSSIRIPTVGDSLDVGHEAACIAGGIYSPSEFYLALATGFPENMNGFIEDMSDSYNNQFKIPKIEDSLRIRDSEDIPPGSIVACWNPILTKREENELVRARIVTLVSQVGRRKEGTPIRWEVYKVFLIDLAVYTQVYRHQIYYLHRDFCKEPAYAFKCRLSLSPFYGAYHAGLLEWTPETIGFMAEVLKQFEKRLDTRFVRRIGLRGPNNEREWIWEVSISKIHPPRRDILETRPVEQQIIERMMGTYFDAEEEVEGQWGRGCRVVRRRSDRECEL